MRVMGGGKKHACLLATDPPYGVDYTRTKQGMRRANGELVAGLGNAQDLWSDIENDAMTPDQLSTLMDAVLAAALPHLVPSSAFYIWHPQGDLGETFRSSMVNANIVVHRTIIWAKPGFVLTRSGMYHWAHESCSYGWLQGHVPPWYGEKNQTSVWHEGKDGIAVHPTQKPVRLFEIPMLNHTLPGGICFEPFSGSGSQIIAGERTGRRVYAMEISPRWVDAAVARWEGLTGNKAHREDP
jgi:DNA modification methylase